MERKKLNFRKLRKFAKNAKALSPVIATIILIAVTVAVSVVVAAWMGGLTLGFMGSAEQASVTNIVLTNNWSTASPPVFLTAQAVVTVQNTGSATVSISSATIDGYTATVVSAFTSGTTTPSVIAANGQVTIAKGTSVVITMTITQEQFSNSAQYTIKLMTAKGNTISSSATYSGS